MQSLITAGLLLLCNMEMKFSLESHHGLEKEIRDWKRANGLSESGYPGWVCIVENVLKRQNKETLISAIVSAVKIIDRSQDILNDAALDLDKVKRDHIENQSKLLVVQEELLNRKSEHLEEVKSTVDEKLTSWADVVKKNNEQ